MKSVIASIVRFHRVRIANVFLVDGGPGSRWLVDTGHVVERATMLRELRRTGLGPRDLTGVLLTHNHSDHAGNAAYFQRRFGVRIYAHRDDSAVLARRAKRMPLERGTGPWTAGLLAAFENYFPAPALQVDVELAHGDEVAGMEVHAVPGHTAGSVFYLHTSTRSLFSGDTLLAAVPPLTLRAGVARAYPSFSLDTPLAHASLQRFHDAGIAYDNLLSGHGRPIVGDARARVLAALGAYDSASGRPWTSSLRTRAQRSTRWLVD